MEIRTDAEVASIAIICALTLVYTFEGGLAAVIWTDVTDVTFSSGTIGRTIYPRRTPGGYRLYSQSDVARLRTILRLQRDEFLPLRVIRQELAAGGEIDLGGGQRLRSIGKLLAPNLVQPNWFIEGLAEFYAHFGIDDEAAAVAERHASEVPEERRQAFGAIAARDPRPGR